MSGHQQESTEDELAASSTPGYRPGQARDLDELARLDAQDESLNKWKASLGVTAGGAGGIQSKVTLSALRLISEGQVKQTLDLTTPDKVAALKKDANITIKEVSIVVPVRCEHRIDVWDAISPCPIRAQSTV